jgi:transposase-like protein
MGSIQKKNHLLESVEKQIQCPKCGSEALNRYGRTHSGKQRFVCLVCGRQFVAETVRKDVDFRPSCPECGKIMHVYMRRKNGLIRFRCANYPECRTFVKVRKENFINESICS